MGLIMGHKSSAKYFDSVVIGTQTWTLKNLDIDDGDVGIYNPNNDVNNVADYGKLYTWDAAVRVAALQIGWHLPTDTELITLTTYLGELSVAGGKMKETGTTHWDSPNTGATNESGFTAVAPGIRNPSGGYLALKNWIYLWSSTVQGTDHAYRRLLSAGDSIVYRNYNLKTNSFSVRLIKD